MFCRTGSSALPALTYLVQAAREWWLFCSAGPEHSASEQKERRRPSTMSHFPARQPCQPVQMCVCPHTHIYTRVLEPSLVCSLQLDPDEDKPAHSAADSEQWLLVSGSSISVFCSDGSGSGGLRL